MKREKYNLYGGDTHMQVSANKIGILEEVINKGKV